MDRALHVDEHAGKAEAPLLHRLELLAGPLDLGIHERRHRRLVLDAVHEHPVQHADLSRRQTDPERVAHQGPHPLDLRAERVVELLDGAGARPEHRIAELADVREGRRAPLLELRIELELLLFLFVRLDLEGLLGVC